MSKNKKKKEENKFEKIIKLLRGKKLFSKGMMMFYAFIIYITVTWFMTINEPTGEHVAFISAVLGTAALFFGLGG